MEDLFFCCKHLPDIDYKYVTEAINGNYRLLTNPSQNIAISSFFTTDFVQNLQKNLGKISTHYVKNNSNTYYDWHVDINRMCSINIPLLTSSMAHTFFRKHIIGSYYELKEVEYLLYKPTVLDISKEHCIINNIDSERIVLNIGIIESSYEDTIKYFKDLQITKY